MWGGHSSLQFNELTIAYRGFKCGVGTVLYSFKGSIGLSGIQYVGWAQFSTVLINFRVL